MVSSNRFPAHLRKAFEPGDDFKPMPAPGPHDWLANHRESGQTYNEYINSGFVKLIKIMRDTMQGAIYLQPVGNFHTGQGPSLDQLKEFAGAYFALDIRPLPPMKIKEHNFTTRINNFTGKRQLLTGDILNVLQNHIPHDAYCELAITMEDLYPDPSWNFVFGQADPLNRVGVFSFARYDPLFNGNENPRDYRKLLLLRSCKVLAHEIGHMFGITHCIFYKCCLNGSNHLKESDSRPIHLCPVCLPKLHYSIGFNVIERYHQLSQVYLKLGFESVAHWVNRRINNISQ
jgi:archaemetzincin